MDVLNGSVTVLISSTVARQFSEKYVSIIKRVIYRSVNIKIYRVVTVSQFDTAKP